MNPSFDGATFSESRDGSRLASQLHAVKRFMECGRWVTLADISAFSDAPQASVSARLRDLRKAKFGGHTIERRYWQDGLWEYRLKLPKGQLSLGLM